MIFIKKLKLLLIIAALALLLCILAPLAVNVVVRLSSKPYIITDASSAEGFDCILVLGCGVINDVPSPMLEDRLKTGISLYPSAAPKLLMSGDNGSSDYDEVSVMRDYALERDVAAEDIFMDHAGFSTYESMYRARDVFEVKKVLIVTQGYHLYRAVYDARALGLDAYGYAADLRQYYGQSFRDLREMLARVKDFAYCIIKPLPTYLGQSIPISGEGNAANN